MRNRYKIRSKKQRRKLFENFSEQTISWKAIQLRESFEIFSANFEILFQGIDDTLAISDASCVSGEPFISRAYGGLPFMQNTSPSRRGEE